MRVSVPYQAENKKVKKVQMLFCNCGFWMYIIVVTER